MTLATRPAGYCACAGRDAKRLKGTRRVHQVTILMRAQAVRYRGDSPSIRAPFPKPEHLQRQVSKVSVVVDECGIRVDERASRDHEEAESKEPRSEFLTSLNVLVGASYHR